jgi:3-oxoacyl-[acyl-carrier protein] reductase
MQKSRRILLITGTSSGLGKDLSKYFLRKNYIVLGCSRTKSKISSKFYKHRILNLNDEREVRKWVEDIHAKYKKIDYLINNAALIPASYPSILNDKELITRVFETNVISQISIINEVAKKMVKKKYGRIISLSSMSVGLLEEGTSLYSSSKNSLDTYSKILSKELVKANITCNTIAPSMYNTKSFRELGETIINSSKKKLQIKRELKLEEITNVIEFLFKKESVVITGQTIYLGLTI